MSATRRGICGVTATSVLAVVSGQSGGQVLVFTIKIKPQDIAAASQIGGGIGEVDVRWVQFVFPERHDLHQASGADSLHCVAIKVALDFDHRQH